MSISNLSELLEQGQCSYSCYDLGRRVQPIAAEQFKAVAEQRLAYPYPHQHQAQFALVFWPQLQQQPEPFIWLLKLPLDERGLVDQQAQQKFIAQVVALLGQQLTGALSEQQQQQLQQSPYLCTPPLVQQAALNAQLRQRFQQPPSLHYEAVESYFADPDQQPWQQLGLQGIHDLAVRLPQLPKIQQQLLAQSDSLPLPFLQALAQALEHPPLPLGLVELLVTALPRLPHERQLLIWRMLASRADEPAVQQALENCLSEPLPAAIGADLIVLIGMRLWPALVPSAHSNLLASYMLQVAQLEQADLALALTEQLLRLPALRSHLLALLRRHDNPLPLHQLWQQLNGHERCN